MLRLTRARRKHLSGLLLASFHLHADVHRCHCLLPARCTPIWLYRSCALQYLELAYYIVYGVCPDDKSRRFLLMEKRFERYSTEATPHFDVFHRMTSTQLNAQSQSWQSWEICFCNRVEDFAEDRNFAYIRWDEQVRHLNSPAKVVV